MPIARRWALMLGCWLPLAAAAAPGQYPVPLRLAGGAPDPACAAPAVLRDARARTATWYLFCGGAARTLPVYRSDDLLHWNFVADAALAPSTALVSAPAPLIRNGRYFLYFTQAGAPDEAGRVSGRASGRLPGCGGSAIFVASAASPAGPWRLGPACVVQGGHEAKAVADGATSWLVYGSAGGGIWVRRLDDDGVAVHGDAIRIGADGRYRGAELVRHEDWWYLFASAGDCCQGALSGSGVFVGRARTPEGPFLDRLGQDMAKGRAGGTPFLLQDGNRRVGPGHATLFADAAGQWWTAYDAVDVDQPWLVAPDGPTRRIAMLDRVDWVDGWPVAGGGPAPGTSPETVTPLWTDTLRDPRLDERWQWLRPRVAGSAGGGLVLAVEPGDLALGANNAGVLQAGLPRGDYRVELELELTLPEGSPGQAGLVLMRDDDNYVKLVETARGGLRQVEFAKEIATPARAQPRYGAALAGTPGRHTWLRLDVHRDGDLERYTAYSSQDGRSWTGGAVWTHRLAEGRPGQVRLGLVAMGGDDTAAGRAVFSRVAVSSLSRRIYDPHDPGRKPLPAPQAPR